MTAPEINGTLIKLRAYAAIVNSVGLGTLLLVVGVGVFTGYLSSPLALEATLQRHHEEVSKIVASRTARDVRLTDALERLVSSAEAQNAINKKLLCLAWAKDEPARQACLRS